MKVEVEEIGPCKKVLKVEVPKEAIEAEWQKQLEKLCKMVNLPGFRKGKAPKSFVVKKYSDRLLDEVKQAVLTDSYHSAIENNKLSPVGEPEVGDINLELGKPLSFEVTMEVLPTFEVGEYKGMRIKRNPVTVSKDDVENALKSMRLQQSKLDVVADGKVEGDDLVTCDCEVKVDGEVVRKNEDLNVIASGTMVADINVPDLGENLSGSKVGENISIKVELDDNFSIEQYRKKPAEVKLSIKEIKRPTGPEINDEAAKEMGYDSLDELKENLTKRIEAEKKNIVEREMRDQIYSKLLEMVNFDLPKDMVESQANKKLEKYRLELLNKGTPLEEIENNMQDLKNVSEESVIKDFKLSLILERIAEKEKIFVTESEIDHRIKMMAGAYGAEPSVMREQLEKMGSIPNLRYQMKESKTVELLIKEAVKEEDKKEEK